MTISFIDLAAQQAVIKSGLEARIRKVLAHGHFIMGPEVAELEAALAERCGSKFALGCANGTDALQLALMALGAGPGDAVFCPSFTFAATAEPVPMTGAIPVFIDVCDDTYNLDVDSLKRAIVHARDLGLKPAGIIPVDLFGLPADYDSIEPIARENDMWIIADSAQSFGASYKDRRTGALGDISTTSFFPAKPLGCYGDGGAVFTNDEGLGGLLDSLRVHGKGGDKYDNARLGLNSRLDTLQAAILLEKLAIFDQEIEARQIVAMRYRDSLASSLVTPSVPQYCRSVWAQYTVRLPGPGRREAVMTALAEAGIPSTVYYPRPVHRQTAYAAFPADPAGLPVSESLSNEVFSLPMHPYLDEGVQARIVDAVLGAIGGR